MRPTDLYTPHAYHKQADTKLLPTDATRGRRDLPSLGEFKVETGVAVPRLIMER